MTITDRIAQLIEDLGYRESAFAKAISVSASVVFNMVNPKGRKSYPSGPVLEKILSLTKENKRVSADWLIRGEGEMFENPVKQGAVNIAEIESTIDQLSRGIEKLREDLKNFNIK